MATILPFNARAGVRRRPGSPFSQPATIVIFPGVRYENAAPAASAERPAQPREAPKVIAPEVKG